MLRNFQRSWRSGFRTAAFCLCVSGAVLAADPAGETPLSGAMTLWRQGDLSGAESILTTMVEQGSTDARVRYLRGVIGEQLGKDGTDDFKAAAELEVASGSSRLVNLALEKTQGPVRARIEAIREHARAAIKPDPSAIRNGILYRDAIAAMKANDLPTARQKLEQAIADGARDPRVHYMRGVVLARAGEIETAQISFRQGLAGELTAQDARNVNEALQGIQGDIRQLIEEQLVVENGDQRITRQSNLRVLLKQEKQREEQLLAADNAERAVLMAESESDRIARETEAAEKILAAEKLKADVDALLKETENAPIAPPAVAEAKPEVKPSGPVANPFGGAPRTAPTVKPAEAESTDTATPVPAAPTNPFTSRPTGSTASTAPAGSVDCSWLAPNSEVVAYIRPADFTNSRFMSPLTELPPIQAAMAQMAAQTGFALGDIESVTFGMGDVMAAAMGIAATAGTSDGPPDPNQIAQQFLSNKSAMSVLRLGKDLDFAAFAASVSASEATHGDKKYFLISSPDPSVPETAFYQVDARTILSTPSEAAMQGALDRGPGSAQNPQFEFLSASSHMAFAFSNPALAAMSGGIPAPDENSPPFARQLVDSIRGRVDGIAIVINTTADLKLDIQLKLNDASSGGDAAKALNEGIAMINQMYPLMKGNVPQPLQPVADSAVASLKAGFRDPVVSASLTIPGSLVTILQQNPDIIGNLIGGAMQMAPPGAGGPPGAGAPLGNPSSGFGTNPPAPQP